jgi:hypothetical protein
MIGTPLLLSNTNGYCHSERSEAPRHRALFARRICFLNRGNQSTTEQLLFVACGGDF